MAAGAGNAGIRTVDEEGGVTAVVDDDVERLGTPVEHLVGAPPVLLEGLALPGEHRGGVARDGGRGVVLGGEDVARAPAHLGAERDQGLDEDGGLDGHVEGAGDVGALEGLGGAELLDHGHETGHLDLRELNLHAACKRDKTFRSDEVSARFGSERAGGVAKDSRRKSPGRRDRDVDDSNRARSPRPRHRGALAGEFSAEGVDRDRPRLGRSFSLFRISRSLTEVGLGHVADLVLAAVDGLDRAHSGGSRHLSLFLGVKVEGCGKVTRRSRSDAFILGRVMRFSSVERRWL